MAEETSLFLLHEVMARTKSKACRANERFNIVIYLIAWGGVGALAAPVEGVAAYRAAKTSRRVAR